MINKNILQKKTSCQRLLIWSHAVVMTSAIQQIAPMTLSDLGTIS